MMASNVESINAAKTAEIFWYQGIGHLFNFMAGQAFLGGAMFYL